MNKKNNKKHQPRKNEHKKPPPGSPYPKVAIQPKFTAIVTMLSDWHIGTGAGRSGDIDSLVQRGPDGLPYIPAKTLTGIWRDACELVALGLDNSDPPIGNWSQWVNYLFGDQPALSEEGTEETPREAALSIRAAYLPSILRQVIASKPKQIAHEIKEAITFVKPGIRIDPITGCAEQDCLRFEEMVRAKATLQASCELNLEGLDEKQQQAAYALVVAGTKFVERIGGNRRRGAGRCELAIKEANLQQSINWIAEHIKKIPVSPKNTQSKNFSAWNSYQIDNSNSWFTVEIRIKTESSLVLAKRTVGNVVETLDYVPGTHLLRLVVRKLNRLGIHISGAIAHGDFVITNATLEVAGKRGRPTPYALFGEKSSGGLDKLDKEGVVYNRFVESLKKEEQKQLKGERQGYIGEITSSNLLTYDKVRTGVETHNTVLDEVQRPTSDVGGVYSYQAIAPNTIFRAEIRLPQLLAEQLARQQKEWWKKLEGCDRLGQSKKDDYGLVSVAVLDTPRSSTRTVTVQGSELTVWLLSDVLLRDERLRPTTSVEALAKELGNHLNVNLNLRDKGDAELLSLAARQHRIESWQVRWGLARPSLVGLSAGSCFVFNVEGTLDPAKLMQLEVTGIGDRCAEGYGQLCFNDPLLIDRTSHLKGDNLEQNNQISVPKDLILQGNQAFEYAQIIEEAAWRTAIQRAALRVAGSPDERQKVLGISTQLDAITTMSQLGGFRSFVNRLEIPQDSLVAGWFGNQAGSEAEKDKWKKRQDKWVGDLRIPFTLVTTPETVWQLLELESDQLILTRNAEQTLKAKLWAEAVQTLVDACIRAHKREKEA